jgi:quercetin dioxygenase-like cupin family protein
MKVSRRDLGIILPALATLACSRSAGAQTPTAGTTPPPNPPPSPNSRPRLETRNYHHDQVPYSGNDQKKGRRFFMGETHGGFNVETHETILAAGVETHAPHRHLHEEVIIVVEGTVETYNEGKTETVEAGSVIFYGSNRMHSARNVGKVPARYYVIELRGEE